MIDNFLNIKYPNGQMTLALTEFFPNTSGNIRKLFQKVISLNWDDEERDRISEHLVSWLTARVEECSNEELMRSLANTAVSAHTKATEMQTEIDKQTEKVNRMKELVSCVAPVDRKKYKDGLKAEKEKLSALKSRQKDCMSEFRFYKNEISKAKSTVEKYKKNLELVKELSGRG